MGDYYADFIIEGKVVVEVKAIKEIGEAEGIQLLNYLKATGSGVGLLLNFGREAEIKRKVYEKDWSLKKDSNSLKKDSNSLKKDSNSDFSD